MIQLKSRKFIFRLLVNRPDIIQLKHIFPKEKELRAIIH
ncbi:hypothetical protein RV17_GL002189 [Enterococcus thailandicus]|nr:hypothetical protein RV17_GL002189 [Enterococcus thailandicus]